MKDADRAAGYRLLETGTSVDFLVVKTEIQGEIDAADFPVIIDIEFPQNPETDETDLEWGAIGFLFVLGVMSFDQARPQEASVLDYREQDELQIADFIECLKWEGGCLRFSADYVRGRRMKTEIVLRPNGTGRITTIGRGKSPLMWLDRLKGQKPLHIVKP